MFGSSATPAFTFGGGEPQTEEKKTEAAGGSGFGGFSFAGTGFGAPSETTTPTFSFGASVETSAAGDQKADAHATVRYSLVKKL